MTVLPFWASWKAQCRFLPHCLHPQASYLQWKLHQTIELRLFWTFSFNCRLKEGPLSSSSWDFLRYSVKNMMLLNASDVDWSNLSWSCSHIGHWAGLIIVFGTGWSLICIYILDGGERWQSAFPVNHTRCSNWILFFETVWICIITGFVSLNDCWAICIDLALQLVCRRFSAP